MSHDPFDALRQPHEAIAPRPQFAEALRRSIEEELGMSTTHTTTDTTASVDRSTSGAPPLRVRGLYPALSVPDGAAALAFYQEALGAQITLKLEDEHGKIGHAQLRVGEASFTIADEFPEIGFVSPATLGGTPVTLTLEVSDVDAFTERAVGAGATLERPPEDQFHGNRTATVADPAGHRWTFRAPAESLTLDELARRAEDGGYTTTSDDQPAPVELGYFTLTVPDVDRAAAFYGELFGWHFDEAPPGGSYRHVSNTRLPFGFVDDPSSPSPHHFYRVDDLDAAVAKVRDLGGEVVEVNDFPSGGNATCRDDQGVAFELWKPAPQYR